MREVAGLFEQPLRPLLLHNDMLESNTPHTDIPGHIPFWGLYCARPKAEMTCRSVEDI
jgi:hypothetical protein